jgi:hypothetical protein
MKKWEIVEKFLYDQERMNEWVDSMPDGIRQAFFDNLAVSTLSYHRYILLGKLFNEYELKEIDWLLHEWLNNRDLAAVNDGIEYKMETIGDALEFYKKFYPEGE